MGIFPVFLVLCYLTTIITAYLPSPHLAPLVHTAGDDTASLATGLGLVLDAQAVFGGPRLQRGAIVIENGKVLSVAVEPSPAEGEFGFLPRRGKHHGRGMGEGQS